MAIDYIQLFIVAMLPVAASGILYYLQKKKSFGNMRYWSKQILIGVIFGILSILGSELGITYEAFNLNVRDAAPLCAGLIFGGPAGIIAGVIGGLERYIGVAWGLGYYTQVACMLGTFFAGLIGALLREFVFERKTPSWVYGFFIGTVTEVFHMLMVIVTHIEDISVAYQIVKTCSFPMILFTSISVMLACIVVYLIENNGKIELKKKQKTISATIQWHMFICVVVAFSIATIFSWRVLQYLAMDSAQYSIGTTLYDVQLDIEEATEKNMSAILQNCALIFSGADPEKYDRLIKDTCHTFDIDEINLIDENGIIIASSNPEYIGYDMSSGEQSSYFMLMLEDDGPDFLVQSLQPNEYGLEFKYAAQAMDNGGILQIGYDVESVHKDMENQILSISRNRHILSSGFVVIANENREPMTGTAVFADNDEEFFAAVEDLVKETTSGNPYALHEAEFLDEPYITDYYYTEGYYLMGAVPESEAMEARNISGYINAYMLTLVFTAVFIVIIISIRKQITNNVQKLNHSLADIADGKLNTEVNVRANAEFSSMSDHINSTVFTLKGYIAEAENRMQKDMALAKAIQASALPSVFPPYPNRHEFDIFASMNPAREVGGDFYDFYLIGENRLAFLIADVSGKGVPAAMFMMTAKTILSNFTESGLPVNEVFTRSNAKLCESNEAEMFVTAWEGVLDLSTGHVSFANAGHNPPLVRRADGRWEYLKSRPGFVLAGMEEIRYKPQELNLQPGDAIFLYTDGVTEATNLNEELYGEDRLLDFLNHTETTDVQKLCSLVKADLDAFVGEADQFDDITMMAVWYHGQLANAGET